MSADPQNDNQDWADNPLLNAWLAKQVAAFPAWATQTGQEWDFSVESLDQLEDLLRRRFSTWEEVKAAEEELVMTVPAWYFGEVQNRHFGTVWQRRPSPPQDLTWGNTPFVTVPEEPHDEEEAEELIALYGDENYRPMCDPIGEIQALFLRGPENRLRDALTRYERP